MASVEKCFTFTWKLENISYCAQKTGEIIKSPTFMVDSIDKSQWYLGLFPRGVWNGDYIGLYLNCKANNGGDSVKLYYDLAFITDDGSVLKSFNRKQFNLPETQCQGFAKFEKRKIVFALQRSSFLPHDTLTARCRIWKCDGEMATDVKCFARSRIGIQGTSFEMNVENFSSLESGKKYTYHIKSVETNKPLILINLSLTGGLSSDEIIQFELSPQDQTVKFSTLRLFLVDISRNRIMCNQDEFWFNGSSMSKEFKFFFTKDKLMAMRSSYLPDDVLSLHWEWVFSEGILSEKIEHVQHGYTNYERKFLTAESMDNKKTLLPYDLSMNLKSLFDENFLCDVKLKTKTRTFNTHKIVLSASSSVFKAMFSNDMKEKESNSVNIEDLTDDTISQMLHYIYTTRVEDLTWETASNLYVAADKYAIDSLKSICNSYLKENLTSINACELLLLSDLHADDDLKSSVKDYILKHIKVIVNSDGWKLMMESNSKLVAETVCLQYK